MRHIYAIDNIKVVEESVVILGNFDGIHIGHQELFELAQKVGKEKNMKTVLLSFSPHPTWILGNSPKSLLMTREEKKKRIENKGIDIYIEYPFSVEFANMGAELFVTEILLEKLNCKAIVIGGDYFFGKNKEGNVDRMKKLGAKHNFEVFAVDEVKVEDTIISSTLIRDLILKGNIELANKLIGQPYRISGMVVKGKQLGRTLGFPTVNIVPDDMKVLPPNGVYISRTHILGECYYSLTNIGNNPTVNGKQKMVETFVFDFCCEVYGENIEVEILKPIREEIKFASLDELTNRMNQDKDIALEYIKHL